MKMSSSRAVYLQGLRLLWSASPIDQALARGQISEDEHRAILDSMYRKLRARDNLKMQWIVADNKGLEVAEIGRHNDGTFTVRALDDAQCQPVVMTSEEQCYRWIDALPRSVGSRIPELVHGQGG
jgi:hypothetical protein